MKRFIAIDLLQKLALKAQLFDLLGHVLQVNRNGRVLEVVDAPGAHHDELLLGLAYVLGRTRLRLRLVNCRCVVVLLLLTIQLRVNDFVQTKKRFSFIFRFLNLFCVLFVQRLFSISFFSFAFDDLPLVGDLVQGHSRRREQGHAHIFIVDLKLRRVVQAESLVRVRIVLDELDGRDVRELEAPVIVIDHNESFVHLVEQVDIFND